MKREMRVQTALMRAVAMILVLSLSGCSGCRRSSGPAPLGYRPRQGKVEQPLIDEMARVPSTTPINIVVILNTNVTEHNKRILFQAITATNQVQKMDKQRLVLTQALKRLAQDSQAPLLHYLHGLETNGVVHNVRSLWISNVIGVKAPAPVIKALAASNEVASLHLDLPRRVIKGAAAKPPWGLTKIGVIDMAPIQIKKTVVVAVLDTGVDYTHLDLVNHMWTGIGWNFSGQGNNNPQDLDGHGTHVAGIIVGDGASGTQTGIAPSAKIMALRETDTLVQSTEQECWDAIQYAVNNKADIINYSSGWLDFYNPDYATWRKSVQDATDANVLFVTVAGDEGQSTLPPFSITTPGRVPAALTVGYCKDGKKDFIPPQSCKGPVTWTNLTPYCDYPNPPGLQKPDLVAPGEGITSTRRGGGYTDMSGTSMAAPHVAGVAALLLAQNPNLNPYDLRYILEESASDAYVPGLDTRSGWGRLNATNAIALAINSTAYDLVVENLHPGANPAPNKSTLFYATAKNMGGKVVGNAELRFYFADALSRQPSDLGNGSPDPTKFQYIGSYFVPVIGPTGSRHEKFEGVVRWTTPGTRQKKWWLGVWVLPGATAITDPEIKPGNNGAVFQLPEPLP